MRWAFLALGVAVATATHPARAQDTDHRKAVQAFTTARAAIDAGNCRAAIPKLRESLAFEASVGAHLSMADCFEQIDALAAWNELKAAEQLAVERSDDRSAVAHARAAALESKLAGLRVTLAAEAAGVGAAEARLDGSVVPEFVWRGGFVAATPGAHTIEVVAPGKRPWRSRVVLSIGSVAAVAVTLEEDAVKAPEAAPVAPPASVAPQAAVGVAPVPASPSMPSEGHAGSAQRTAGFVTGGVGLALLGVGGAFGIAALVKSGDLRNACGGDVQRCDA
jgi:hypothetical protein